MNIILLSGGSGKRLWPLSNDIRSKQFIKIFKDTEGDYESMVQRVYHQIRSIDPDATVTIATSRTQVSAIHNQLGPDVGVCVEPCRRDTFPAIALATAYLTDIQERYKIKNDSDLQDLIDIIASSIGGLTNPTKLENTFRSVKKSDITHTTIKKYLDILGDSYLVDRAVRYDIKGRKYIDTPSKYYFTDIGLRNARLGFRQNEVTHAMENIIYNELCLRGMSVDVGVVGINIKDEDGKSARKQLEVDFVCNKGSDRYYIQSAFRLPTQEKRDQETRSLRHIGDSFKKIVITDEPIRRYQDDSGIIYMNLYEFLLNESSL